MTKIIIVNKLGNVTNKNVKNLNIETIYKQCNLKKSTNSFKLRHTWKNNNSSFVSIYAKDSGRAGSENKYELPRPIDDFTVPDLRPPASVIPICRGQSSMSANWV